MTLDRMVIPGEKHHVIWIRMAKCAGTSLREHLKGMRRYAHPQMIRAKTYKPGVHILNVHGNQLDKFADEFPDIWEDSFRFAVIRDPYDRARSGWAYHHKLKSRELIDVLRDPPGPDEPGPFFHFTLSQTQATRCRGIAAYHRLVRMENFDAEISELFNELGLGKQPPFKRQNVGGQKSHREFTDDELRLIEELFADDFETFGYPIRM